MGNQKKLFSNILVLAPHTDDGELGAGGTISKFIKSGSKVSYIAFSSCKESVPTGFPEDVLIEEAKKATKLLGVKKKDLYILDYKVRQFDQSRQEILDDIIEFRNNNNFDLVLMPSLNDVHQDHSVIAFEGLRAFKNSSTILSYDLPWNNPSFNSSCFIEISEIDAKRKYEALKCYKSQKNRIYMQKDNIFGLLLYNGMQKGSKYAESFEVVRWYIN